MNPTGGTAQLERFEGMRVSIPSLSVVGPADGTAEHASVIAAASFYGVLPGVASPLREPGVLAFLPVPTCAAGAGCAIPVFDANPERIAVQTGVIIGQAGFNVGSGQTVSNLVGVLEQNTGSYRIFPTQPPTIGGTPVISAAIPTAPAGALSVVAMNLGQLFDTADDPFTDDLTANPIDFNNRLSKLSDAIRNNLRAPDVIALEEVENLTIAQALAARINNDAVAASQPNPGYTALLAEGNDGRGLDVGLLVRSRHRDHRLGCATREEHRLHQSMRRHPSRPE